MMEDGRLVDAVFAYERIVDNKLAASDELKGNIYHNLGCALCGLFFYKKAVENFELAYRLNRNIESARMMLFAALFGEDEESFNLLSDRYQILPEEVANVKKEFLETFDSSENILFRQRLYDRVDQSKDEVERELIYRDYLDEFKADYKSLRTY